MRACASLILAALLALSPVVDATASSRSGNSKGSGVSAPATPAGALSGIAPIAAPVGSGIAPTATPGVPQTNPAAIPDAAIPALPATLQAQQPAQRARAAQAAQSSGVKSPAAAPRGPPAKALGSASGVSGAALGPSEDLDAKLPQAPKPGTPARPASSDSGEAVEHGVLLPAEPGSPRSIGEITLDPLPGHRYHASPKSWSEQAMYFAMLDRFAKDGAGKSWGKPEDAGSRHGGNIRGMIGKLDYLMQLGVTTLVVTPPMMNPPAGYHGYWPVNFLAVDPHLGTMEDFRDLVREAHKRHILVVMDVVFNHIGPVIEYHEGYKWTGQQKTIKRWKYPVVPMELQKPEHYHRMGSIDNWDDPLQMMLGDFPGGLNQLATERPETQDILLKIAMWWIKETDIDGFRLDTYQHVDPAFWKRFHGEVRGFARSLGKDDFLMLGEIFHGDPAVLAREMGAEKLNAIYNYPGYFWAKAALHGEAPSKALEHAFDAETRAFGEQQASLVRFLDNHDKPRFLRAKDPVGRLKVAIGYLMLSVGIQYLYYGTEQAFRQYAPGDLDMNFYREDMFEGGKFKSPSSGTGHDRESEIYKFIRKLSEVRRSFPALLKGKQWVRWSDPDGPGIYAFSRIHGDQEVLVVLNTSDQTKRATMFVDAGHSPPGSIFSDLLDLATNAEAYAGPEGGSKLAVSVPPLGVRVFARRVVGKRVGAVP